MFIQWRHIFLKGVTIALQWILGSHGRSEGDLITYGHLERVDVKFFLDYIYDHYGLSEKLVLWGQSMGAAVAFLVAESDSRVNLLVPRVPTQASIA